MKNDPIINTIHTLATNKSHTYKSNDLKVDENFANRYLVSDYIFVDRDAGTTLLPLRKGLNSWFVETYKTDNSAKFYHIKSDGSYEEINSDKAVYFARMTPNLPKQQSKLISVVQSLLNDFLVVSPNQGTMPEISIEPFAWGEWLNWFSSIDNPPMLSTMKAAISRMQ